MIQNSGRFIDLELWKKSRIFCKIIYEVTLGFPKEEKYRLCDQLIRSSRSICANIAEGHGRFHFQENIQFCRIARGSLSETFNHLICALDCKYLQEPEFKHLEELILEIERIINGYIRYIKKQKIKSS